MKSMGRMVALAKNTRLPTSAVYCRYTTSQGSASFVNSGPMRHFSLINGSGNDGADAASADSETIAKESAKDFMKSVKEELIDELKSYDEWLPKVMEETTKPVLLDCYADWCAPCRKIMPVLEQATLEAEGKFKLVKLNIDNLPQLANGLSVKSIPAIFLIYRGNIIDSMTGFDPNKLQEMINTAELVNKAQYDETIMVSVLAEAQKMIEEKSYENAEQVLRDGYTYE